MNIYFEGIPMGIKLFFTNLFILILLDCTAQNSAPKKVVNRSSTQAHPKMGLQEYIYSDKMVLPKVPTISEEVVQMALGFMGTPAPHFITDAEFARLDPREVQLQPMSREYLAVCLDILDCVGFVETVIAIAQTHHIKSPSFALFKQSIRQLRYRNGASIRSRKLEHS